MNDDRPLSAGHCSECDPSYGCFSGRGLCCKSPEPEDDGAAHDRKRALRLAHQFTLETQTCEEAVSDLCRQLVDARRMLGVAGGRKVEVELALGELLEACGPIAKAYTGSRFSAAVAKARKVLDRGAGVAARTARASIFAKFESRIENLRSALSEIAEPEHQPIHPAKRIALDALEADDLEVEGG